MFLDKINNASIIIAALLLLVAPTTITFARTPNQNIPHLIKKGTATQLIVDNQPFVMLAGEPHNSSSSSLEFMEPLWPKLVKLNLNTLLAQISWQAVEPQEGKFDFSLVDGLIHAARKHNLRLVFLWFGTWKNTISCYVPDWVKKDTHRFKRIRRDSPRKLKERWGFEKNPEVISPLCLNARDADKRAFAALLGHIRDVDSDTHTVLMIQVENETGLLGDSRDRSPLAEQAFSQPVPAQLLQYLQKNADSLIPELREIWARNGFKTAGSWSEVFGPGPEADEIFTAWHTARYIDEVAKAGKAAYPLPMFVNAWLINPLDEPGQELPGDYPSGGPVSKMLDIWRAAAPSIDLLAPDIYASDFKTVCRKYTRSGNPLLIPEAKRDTYPERKVLYAIGEHDAICFSPLGIDNPDFPDDHPIADTYRLVSSILHLITEFNGTGKTRAFLQYDEQATSIDFGKYRFDIAYNHKSGEGPVASGLIIQLQPDEFLVAGLDCTITFTSKDPDLPRAGVLTIQEGRYENQQWLPGRLLNGDETGHGTDLPLPSNFADTPFPLRKLRLYQFN